ncbi:MAG: cyclic nucleotide-binding domain-containing protein [Oscillospiraceae bacterium]|nr:cyclic nucleotide-binding domain-containing protein [Oscillospiraceae bacterium]
MNTRSCQKGEIVFRQGDAGETMFRVARGVVSIYVDYGTEKERRLVELVDDAFFGEMGLIDHAPRSATAVALEDGTKLEEIAESDLDELFQTNPEQVLAIMRQLSERLRGLTKDYMEACKTAALVVSVEEKKPGLTAEETDEVWEKAEYFSRVKSFGYEPYE